MAPDETAPRSVLPCFHCGTVLLAVLPDSGYDQPDDGVVFLATGNFGSTVFDPMDGTRLKIHLCDRCLTEAADADRVLILTTETTKSYRYAPWKGHDPQTGESRR